MNSHCGLFKEPGKDRMSPILAVLADFAKQILQIISRKVIAEINKLHLSWVAFRGRCVGCHHAFRAVVSSDGSNTHSQEYLYGKYIKKYKQLIGIRGSWHVIGDATRISEIVSSVRRDSQEFSLPISLTGRKLL